VWQAVVRFAALDMRGGGSRWRPTIVLAEFWLTAALGFLVGSLVVTAADSPQTYLLGAWLVGIGLNYAPLVAAATSLHRHQRLDREIADTPPLAAQHRATAASLWLIVPAGILILAKRRARHRRTSRSHSTTIADPLAPRAAKSRRK
jgi:hypothetical protein